MNTQKRDIVNVQKMIWGDASQLCECGDVAKKDSCYCQSCEDNLYRNEQ